MPTSNTISVEKKKLEKPPLALHFLGDRVLRQKAKRISRVDATVRDLAKEMLQTMYSSDGIGLAAPQVAVNKQMLVVDDEPDNAAKPPLVLINPVIKAFSREIAIGQEGCLSVPGVFLDVKRPAAIEVQFKDERGRPQKIFANDLLARVIQHEMDHLNGVMFVDRVENQLALTEALGECGFAVSSVQAIA